VVVIGAADQVEEMDMQSVTIEDVRRAFTAHVDALKRCGIGYDGRLVLTEGSKYCGNAYRINLTGFPNPCQNRKYNESTMYRADGTSEKSTDWDRDWDHAGCQRCNGTKIETCSGHAKPPVGDDYLGMTKREAYETLVARTGAVYDTATALEALQG